MIIDCLIDAHESSNQIKNLIIYRCECIADVNINTSYPHMTRIRATTSEVDKK
jgi:hypothetical protein